MSGTERAFDQLPPAPVSAVTAVGAPAVGAYAGTIGDIDWRRLAPSAGGGLLSRLTHTKRWHYVSLATPECVAALAIVDLGWMASAFMYVFDRAQRCLRVDRSWIGVPRVAAEVARQAGAGARSRFRRRGVELVLESPAEPAGIGPGASAWRVRGSAGAGLQLEASLDAAAAPATIAAVAAITGGGANATHKTVCVPITSGFVEAGGRRFPLAGGFAAIDHTHGLLARETRWRWASAAGARIGLNLVEGFNGPVENAVWIDGRLCKVGAAEIRPTDPRAALSPWIVRTFDGCVDLLFHPEGCRAQDRNLVVARSRYEQPIGTFQGSVRPAPGATPVAVAGLCGVTEDHAARW